MVVLGLGSRRSVCRPIETAWSTKRSSFVSISFTNFVFFRGGVFNRWVVVGKADRAAISGGGSHLSH